LYVYYNYIACSRSFSTFVMMTAEFWL
jgi:hypothetical protein